MTHPLGAGQAPLPERPPMVLIALAAALGIAGLVTTPDLMIALGPLGASLTSDNEMTRRTAELTVLGFRVACVAAVLLLAVTLLRWRLFVGSSAMRTLATHQVPRSEEEQLESVWNRSLAIAAALTGILLLYVVIAPAILPYEAQSWIASEAGIVERGTAAVFLVSSVMAFLVVGRLRTHPSSGPNVRRIVWLTLLGIFFFLCAGEEISWGQRILDVQTIDALKGVNVQDENNLHNIAGYLADHLFILGVLVYGCVLPLLGSRFPFVRRTCHWLGLPLASLGLAVGFGLASGLHDWTMYRVLPRNELRAAEVRELISGVCFLLLMVESRRLAGKR